MGRNKHEQDISTIMELREDGKLIRREDQTLEFKES